MPLTKVYSRKHCTAHAHKAESNVIKGSENTLGSRTRESEFFYVWLTLLLPVMFRIIAVRSKADTTLKFPQLVGLKISPRYDGLQVIQTLQISAGFSIAWNMNQTKTDCMPFSNHLREPKKPSKKRQKPIGHLKCSNKNSIDNVRPKNQNSTLNIYPSLHAKRWLMDYATLWVRPREIQHFHPEDLIYSSWVVLVMNTTGFVSSLH